MKKRLTVICLIMLLSSCAATTDLKHQKEIARATKDLGEAYLSQGNYTAALKELLTAEKTIPDDPYLQNDLGLAYIAKKRPGLAESHFKRAVTLKPDYIPAKNNLGSAYLKQKKWDEAIDCFESITGELLYATPEKPFCNLGWAYLGKKAYRQAKENFAKAIDIRPGFINAIHGIAVTNLATRQAHLSVELLEKTVADRQGIAILHYDLAKTYEALDRHRAAKKQWRAVMELSPDSDLAKEAKRHL
ncbi:MAG: tetratricopeptide repeat protein [Desulfobacteraceae bacterium]